MQYLLYPIAIYALLVVIRYLITFLQLRKLTLQYPKYQVPTDDAVPVYLKELLKTPARELEKFGFKPCSYLQVEPMLKLHPPITWEILLYNEALTTYAKVALRRLVEPANLFEIEFYTFFQDKDLLLTMNGRAHGILGEVPNYLIQDLYTAQTSVQWQAHQDRLDQLTITKTSHSLAPSACAQTLQIHIKNYIDYLAKVGTIFQVKGTELFQLNWLAALKMVTKIVQGNKKAAAIIKQRRQQAKTDSTIQVEIPVEIEVEGFQHTEQLHQGLVDKQLRTWLLLSSLGLFIASYTKLLSSQSLVIFIAALVFHEGGHLLAMKLCGYQDISVLFLPFLGAVATARKDDATLTQKFWVSLAGPLPGLLLGIALAHTTHGVNYPAWVQEAGWILISLNLFNLLPVYPLDGGQIADLLVFSRYPYIGLLFKVFGVISLGVLGFGQPLLLLFAILIALTIPSSFRSAFINSKLRKELRQIPSGEPEYLLHSIFKNLKQLGYGNLPFSTRYALAKGLIRRYHESSTKWTTRVLLVILYCGSLLGGMAISLQVITPNWVRLFSYYFDASHKKTLERITKDRKREIERATEALRFNPNDINAYVKRARAHAWLHDYKGALADYNQIIRLDSKATWAYLKRGYARQQLQDYKGAIADANSAIKLAPNQPNAYILRSEVRRCLGDDKGATADDKKAEALAKAIEKEEPN